MENKPYLSLVACSRNDNHGGDMYKRMNIFVRGLIHQTRKYKLPVELIMVEWNPPEDKPLLHEILPKPEAGDPLVIRYIVVSKTLHETFEYHHLMPLFQMIAKNVGIRRATADYVLCTNVDLLFSDLMFEWLAGRPLEPDSFYRANRCDVPKDIKEDQSIPDMLAYCEANILKRAGKNALFPHFSNTTGVLFRQKWLFGYLSIMGKISAAWHGKKKILWRSLDTDACGDFTLMSKAAWEDIEGYAELESYSIHIDSLGVYAAAARDYKQVILPHELCTFHISHKGGWEFEDPIQRLTFSSRRPMLEWHDVETAGQYIIENQLRLGINKPDWGLMNEDLEEHTIGSLK